MEGFVYGIWFTKGSRGQDKIYEEKLASHAYTFTHSLNSASFISIIRPSLPSPSLTLLTALPHCFLLLLLPAYGSPLVFSPSLPYLSTTFSISSGWDGRNFILLLVVVVGGGTLCVLPTSLSHPLLSPPTTPSPSPATGRRRLLPFSVSSLSMLTAAALHCTACCCCLPAAACCLRLPAPCLPLFCLLPSLVPVKRRSV